MYELVIFFIMLLFICSIACIVCIAVLSSNINKKWYEEELRRHDEIVDSIKKGENEFGER